MTEEPAQEPEHLAEAVRSLSGTVDALRADVRRMGAAPVLPSEGTDGDISHTWVSALASPAPRRLAVPRFLLETLFLGACAAAAAIAELEALAILGVMVGAWVLVGLIEWAASRADQRRDELLYAPPPVPSAPAAPAADPAWFSPPVEHTMLDAGESSETAITRLPPLAEEAETTMEHRLSDQQ
jgi:hypothetical protein